MDGKVRACFAKSMLDARCSMLDTWSSATGQHPRRVAANTKRRFLIDAIDLLNEFSNTDP